MRDERISNDVYGEATAPLYQERLFSLVYTQILVEYPLKLIQRAVPSGLLANLFFLLTLPPLCSPSALYEESTVSSSPVTSLGRNYFWANGSWSGPNQSSLWRNRLASISWLLVAEFPSDKNQFVASKILIYDLKRERNVFVYVFCFVVFVFFFSTSITLWN